MRRQQDCHALRAASPDSSRLKPRMVAFLLAARRACLPAALALFAATPTLAQGTHLWTQSRMEEFEKGTPQGVAIGSDGKLHQGPGLRELATTPSTFVWAVAVDKSGNVYAATGSPATVLRFGPEKDAKPVTLFETHDLTVQALRIGPDGALYAATLPSGKVYKLNPAATEKLTDATATVVFDAATADSSSAKHAHYIWDLTFDAQGRLYIAAGGPAAVYRVDVTKPGAKPELFFHCDEQHIRSLAWDAKGNLIAGSDGSGLVYRISPEGKGYVLFEAPRREVTSVAVGADGTIYAAAVGDKSRNPLPPIPLQGTASITFTVVQPGSLQAANTSTTVPEGSELYALTPDQAPRKIWAGKDEVVYALAAEKDGVLALSGNRGRVFRIAKNGDYADIAHLDAQQALCFAAAPNQNRKIIGTGNTGKVVELGASDSHAYASDVLDAGALARFGRVEIDPGAHGYTLYTRSGNVEQPARGRGDWGWSEWQPLTDGKIASPAGRYLQWKIELAADGELGSVGINYLPVNAAPQIDDIVVVPGARVNAQPAAAAQQTVPVAFASASATVSTTADSSTSSPLQAQKDKSAVTVRWAAHDDNGDDLKFSLYLRGDGESVWRLLKDDLSDKAYSFDAAQIPDGGYQVKIVASDAPSHTPSDALTGEKISERFEVDTTAPVLRALKAEPAACTKAPCAQPVHVTFEAEDAASPIAHAEYSLDAGPWQFIEPVGGLSDAKTEHYDFTLPANTLKGPAEHLLTVRVYDRYDNAGVAKTVFTAASEAR